MTQRAWMAVAERLMNLMESFDYKSEQYNVCRKVLLTHLAQKPTHDEEVEAWPMTGPAPFEDDVPLPEVAVEKKRKPATKKAASPKEPSAKKPSVAKAKRVRKKKAVSPTGNPEENSGK